MFKDITPESILISKNIKGLADGAEVIFSKLFQEVINVLIYPRIDELPEEVVDLLAWQFHVDEYHVAKTLEEKRNIVKKAIELHRYKGTKYSVEETLRWLASINAQVKEWFEYGGEPYRFKLRVFSDIPTPEKWDDLLKIVIEYKNVRSWFDGVEKEKDYQNTVLQGAALKESKIESVFIRFKVPDHKVNLYEGEALRFQKKISIRADISRFY